MEWVYNTPTPPFKSDFMMDLYEIIRNIDAYRAQQQGYGNPLQLFLSRKVQERGKTTWGKSSLKNGKGTELNNMS